jgi:hypothetical protein
MPHRVTCARTLAPLPVCSVPRPRLVRAFLSLSLVSLSLSWLAVAKLGGQVSFLPEIYLSIDPVSIWYRSICHKYKFAFNSGVSDQGLPKGGHYIRGNKLGRRKYGGGGGRRPWGLWGRTLGSRPV